MVFLLKRITFHFVSLHPRVSENGNWTNFFPVRLSPEFQTRNLLSSWFNNGCFGYWELGFGHLGYCLVVTQVNHCIVEYAQWPIIKATFLDLAVHPFRKRSTDNKWFPFQTPNWAELQILKPRIPDSTGKNFPDFGIRHVSPDSPKIIVQGPRRGRGWGGL